MKLKKEETILVNTGDGIKISFLENNTNNLLEFYGIVFIGSMCTGKFSYGGLVKVYNTELLQASIWVFDPYNSDGQLIMINSSQFLDKGSYDLNIQNVPIVKSKESHIISNGHNGKTLNKNKKILNKADILHGKLSICHVNINRKLLVENKQIPIKTYRSSKESFKKRIIIRPWKFK